MYDYGYQADADAADRAFWRNRRRHAYWQTPQEEQREAFIAEASQPEPQRKPLGRVLPIVKG